MSPMFAVMTERKKSVLSFLAENRERLSLNPNAKFFIKKYQTKVYMKKKRMMVLVDMPLSVPKIWMASPVLFLIGIVFQKLAVPFFILGSLMFLSGAFWSSNFFFLMFKKGLKKVGYRGEIKRLKLEEALRGVSFESD